MIDLNLFCAHPADSRSYLRTAWREPFGIARCSGHILVVVPDDGGVYADAPANNSISQTVSDFKAQTEVEGRTWLVANYITMPFHQAHQNHWGAFP